MTLDQIDRIVRQANPVPDLTALEPVAASVPVLNEQRRTDMQPNDRVVVEQGQEMPERKSPFIGIAAVVLAVIGALILFRPGVGEPVVATTTPVIEAPESAASAVEIAAAFAEAYGAFDVDGVAPYLAADARFLGLDGGGEALHLFDGDPGPGWRAREQWAEAQGFKLLLDSCDERTTWAYGTRVRCTWAFHGIRSDEMGLGPFRGSYFDLIVHEGKVISVGGYLYAHDFFQQVWEPFARWVTETHPDDVAAMYLEGAPPQQSLQQLTEESIALWEQHSREYVEVVKQG